MRINRFVALATGMSRRAADTVIAQGRVGLNGNPAQLSTHIEDGDVVTLDGKILKAVTTTTIMLNKPVGYVVSREGQGSKTVYDLLPPELHNLKPIGRLDKNSSGLLLMTNDGQFAQELTHPRYQKQKVYEVELDKPLTPLHRQMIEDHGVLLEDGSSKLQLARLHEDNNTAWKVIMSEGRNRQIRRTFVALGYKVIKLHRTHFGHFSLGGLNSGRHTRV